MSKVIKRQPPATASYLHSTPLRDLVLQDSPHKLLPRAPDEQTGELHVQAIGKRKTGKLGALPRVLGNVLIDGLVQVEGLVPVVNVPNDIVSSYNYFC